jgi:hypothetical protein
MELCHLLQYEGDAIWLAKKAISIRIMFQREGIKCASCILLTIKGSTLHRKMTPLMQSTDAAVCLFSNQTDARGFPCGEHSKHLQMLPGLQQSPLYRMACQKYVVSDPSFAKQPIALQARPLTRLRFTVINKDNAVDRPEAIMSQLVNDVDLTFLFDHFMLPSVHTGLAKRAEVSATRICSALI